MLSLRLFVSLCENRNLTKVAQRFNLVPSAISKRMSKLEAELGGTSLFKRLRHGMEPTAAGLQFFKHVQGVLQDLDKAATQLIHQQQGHTGQIRLISSVSVAASGLEAEIHHYLRLSGNKNVNIELHLANGEDTVTKLMEEMFSVGVLWNVQDTSGLVTLPYRGHHLCVVTPKSHPLASRQTLQLKEALAYDMVGIHSAIRAETTLRRMKALENIPSPMYRLLVPSTPHALKAVQAGLGLCISTLEAQNTNDLNGLVFIPLQESWATHHFVICYKDTDRTPAVAKQLAHYLSEASQVNASYSPPP